MNIITEELENIDSSIIKRRLFREFKQLTENQIINPETIKINIDESISNYAGHCYYTIEFVNSKDNRHYKFKINNNYPFTTPKLELNFKPYSYYLNISSDIFKNKLTKYKQIRCFCCSTITCGSNWSPAYTMEKVINEIEQFRNISKEIFYIVIIDVIKRKYLIDDINIRQWLI
jgi:ubiquitin-protein ligase